eukprot:TRINITY_DN7181_c0_g1_i1.p1 TRINITY_DN7181_c0_g1~~TRINITY_DN7181_c0_g1_i1.p1  ORF type:complete len:458 (-),score=89.22 TRINITY_DN7181_c0_g1_i1:120-1493(-)
MSLLDQYMVNPYRRQAAPSGGPFADSPRRSPRGADFTPADRWNPLSNPADFRGQPLGGDPRRYGPPSPRLQRWIPPAPPVGNPFRTSNPLLPIQGPDFRNQPAFSGADPRWNPPDPRGLPVGTFGAPPTAPFGSPNPYGQQPPFSSPGQFPIQPNPTFGPSYGVPPAQPPQGLSPYGRYPQQGPYGPGYPPNPENYISSLGFKPVQFDTRPGPPSGGPPGQGEYRKVDMHRSHDMREIANAFKAQLDLERDLENIKEDLVSKSDFTFPAAFREFDTNDSGLVSLQELTAAFRRLGVEYNEIDLDLFLTRLRNLGFDKLGINEFKRFLLPLSLKLKPHLVDERTNSRGTLGRETRALYIRFWKSTLASETEHERIRQKLLLALKGTIEDAFREIDFNDSGYLTIEELLRFLMNHGYHVSRGEIHLLLDRYDRFNGKDGRLSLQEVLEELRPKSRRDIR